MRHSYEPKVRRVSERGGIFTGDLDELNRSFEAPKEMEKIESL